ncbi:MAG: WD40-repeat-containing domain protein [Benniella sp.]|nr:MAG: WD40-repeat-containing domain protein [Benniella sp.]
MTTTRISQITAKRIPFTAFQALWVPGTTRICSLGSNDAGLGVIQVHALTSIPTAPYASPSAPTTASPPSSQHRPKLVIQYETEKKTQLKSGTFRASARSSTLPHLLAGDFEGRVGLWDLSRTEVPVSIFKAHEDVVNCMDGAGSLSGRPEFITGCRDGTVRLWDIRQNHKEASGAPSPLSDMSLKKGRQGHEVWCVALGKPGSDTEAAGSDADDLLVAAGYDNGDVRVMDIRVGRAIFETNLKHGVCAVEFDKRQGKAGKLVATTLEGMMYSFDMFDGQFPETGRATQEAVRVQTGDDSTLWQARHIPQRSDIVAVTDGGGQIFL